VDYRLGIRLTRDEVANAPHRTQLQPAKSHLVAGNPLATSSSVNSALGGGYLGIQPTDKAYREAGLHDGH